MSEIQSGIKVEKEVPNPMQDNAEEVTTNSQEAQTDQSPEVGELLQKAKSTEQGHKLQRID